MTLDFKNFDTDSSDDSSHDFNEDSEFDQDQLSSSGT